jgi:hypothetical protein
MDIKDSGISGGGTDRLPEAQENAVNISIIIITE